MSYVDLNTIHNPATGTVAPAAWGDQIRDNLEFLIDPPVCSAFNSSAVSVPHNTATVLNANSENFDNDAMHSTVSNTSRITAQTAGRYLFVTSVAFATNSSGSRGIEFYKNGVATGLGAGASPSGVANPTFSATTTIVLAATDYVQVFAFQSSTVSLNTTLVEFAAVYLTR